MKNIHLVNSKAASDCSHPTEATSGDIHQLINEQLGEDRRYKKDLIISSYKLNDICNHFDKLISTTQDANQLQQAIIDAGELCKFYEDYNEVIFKNDIERLYSIIEKGKKRTGILTPNETKKTPTKTQPFIDYLKHNDKPALMIALKELIANNIGREIALIIRALYNMNFIKIPNQGRAGLYRSMRAEFGDIGADQSINDFMISDKTTEPFPAELKAIIEKLPPNN